MRCQGKRSEKNSRRYRPIASFREAEWIDPTRSAEAEVLHDSPRRRREAAKERESAEGRSTRTPAQVQQGSPHACTRADPRSRHQPPRRPCHRSPPPSGLRAAAAACGGRRVWPAPIGPNVKLAKTVSQSSAVTSYITLPFFYHHEFRSASNRIRIANPRR